MGYMQKVVRRVLASYHNFPFGRNMAALDLRKVVNCYIIFFFYSKTVLKLYTFVDINNSSMLF